MSSARNLVVSLALIVAGCGGYTKIDATSDQSLETTLGCMIDPLKLAEQTAFEADCATIVFKDAGRTALGGTRGKVPRSAALFRPLHGKTVADIRDQAARMRKAVRDAWMTTMNSTSAARDQPNVSGPAKPLSQAPPAPIRPPVAAGPSPAELKAAQDAAADEEARQDLIAWNRKVEEAYPDAKKSLIEAKNRGSKAALSARSSATKRAINDARSMLCARYNLNPKTLDRLMADGKAREERSKKETNTSQAIETLRPEPR